MITAEKPILVTGATGYVGGRLVPFLLERGYKVRAAGRSLAKLGCRPWAGEAGVELVRADMHDRASLDQACRGCAAAYYLVHSMVGRNKDFESLDRAAAANFRDAAGAAGLERIIYLSGLGGREAGLSRHLKSRTEVGRILGSGPAALTTLRAAMILGSGSASFEILRYLVERLPVMVAPVWVETKVQPIAVSNVLTYLAGCLADERTSGQTLDIGGAGSTSYRELFQMYARAAGLRRRLIIGVPFFTPRLSSYWIHLVTPLPAVIARPLAEGLKNKVVADDRPIRELIPQRLLSPEEAIEQALSEDRLKATPTDWTDAGQLRPPEWTGPGDAAYAGGSLLEAGYRVELAAGPEAIWPAVESIGGRLGWGYGQWLWRLRGMIDKLIGGVPLSRGRRRRPDLGVGQALDFWRVLAVEPGRRLVLLAEMRTPGEAVLEIGLTRRGPDRTELALVSRFRPRGLAGLAYWYAALPAHDYIFRGMTLALAARVDVPVLTRPTRFQPKPMAACRI